MHLEVLMTTVMLELRMYAEVRVKLHLNSKP